MRAWFMRSIAGGIAAVLLLVSCGAQDTSVPGAEGTIASTAIETAEGVVLLSPIGSGASSGSSFDTDVMLTIDAFAFDEPSAEVPMGPPIGPSFSTADGSVKIQDGAYAATWRTRQSAQPTGTLVRVEVRLANAAPGSPACNEGVDVQHAGCLAYFDAFLASRPNAPLPDGLDGDTVVLRNEQGTSIRFYIHQDAANVAPAVDILATEMGFTVSDHQPLELSATATDLEDGDLTGAIVWASDLDGVIGTGGSLSAVLSAGFHTVRASVTDSAGATSMDERAALSLAFTQVNPVGTYLFTGNDSDDPDPPTSIDLSGLGASAGDYLVLESFGDYRAGDGFVDDSEWMLVVFRGDAGPLATDGGIAYETAYCQGVGDTFENISNDIPEDFRLADARFTFVEVPVGATSIAFSTPDCYFRDNTDPDGDYGVAVGVLHAASVDSTGAFLETAPEDAPSPATTLTTGELGAAPGDFLALHGKGEFKAGSASDEYANKIAVFTDGSEPIGTEDGSAVETFTCFGDIWGSNDIPQDFLVSNEDFTFVRVPAGATELRVSAEDCFFADNSDLDGDFGILWTP